MSVAPHSARLRPFRPIPFGRYTLLLPLSSGGMGEIYLARLEGARGFEKLCVIKKILPQHAQDPEFVERFVNEAKTLVTLSHGSIAQVLDMGLHAGEPYLALEYVDGKDLRKVVARSRDQGWPLPLTYVLYVMSRVLDALAYAHRKRGQDEQEIGLVHRDISPQNILISYEGEVKVIDFGLAKSTLNASATHPSIILGKFLYMSPEQARHHLVDRRSDLYSVGMCLYELIAGKNPFDGVSPGELISRVASASFPPLRSIAPHCPVSLEAVVTQATSADPAQRFQTAEALRGKLLACLVELDESAGPEGVSRFMHETFSQEYQQERRLLSTLRDLGQPAVHPPKAPAMETETAIFSLAVAAAPSAITKDDVPLAEMAAPLDELTVSHIPEPGDERTQTSAPSLSPTSPAVRPVDTGTVRVSSSLTRPLSSSSPSNPAADVMRTEMLRVKRSPWPLLLPVVVFALAGVGFCALRSEPPPPNGEEVGPRGLSPVVEPSVVPSVGAEPASEPDDELLAVPLSGTQASAKAASAKPAPSAPARRNAKPPSLAASREYVKTRASFDVVKRRHGCEAMGTLCARFEKLTEDFYDLSIEPGNTNLFLQSSRKLRQELDARPRK